MKKIFFVLSLILFLPEAACAHVSAGAIAFIYAFYAMIPFTIIIVMTFIIQILKNIINRNPVYSLQNLKSLGFVGLVALIVIPIVLAAITTIRSPKRNALQRAIVNEANIKTIKKAAQNVDINAVFLGDTALSDAALRCNLEAVKFLVEQGADINLGSYSPIHGAFDPLFRPYDFELMKYLIDQGADLERLSQRQETPLYIAVRYASGDDKAEAWQEIMRYLTERGADINSMNFIYGDTPLHLAAEKGDIKSVKYLIEHGADVNAYNTKAQKPVDLAKTDEIKNYLNTPEIKSKKIKRMKQKHRNYEVDSKAPDIMTNMDITKYFVEKGIDLNYKSYRGTALDLAVKKNNLDIVKYLLDNGADPNIYYGCPAITQAIRDNNLEMVKVLLKAGAEISRNSMCWHNPGKEIEEYLSSGAAK